tara:strand:- start:117 stop:404 length:288 start_codon:yes stop_codon:yes gene_type:complete
VTDIEKSREKFEEALFRLEQMVDSVKEQEVVKSKKLDDEIALKNVEEINDIKKDRDSLKIKLEEATRNFDSLSEVTSKLSMRLDKTIEKLKSILE